MRSTSSEDETCEPKRKRKRPKLEETEAYRTPQSNSTQELVSRNKHRFDGNEISGEATVHLGDRITVNHNSQNLPNESKNQEEEDVKILLDSLSFQRMGARDREVRAPLPKTCQWLFQHEHFKSWTDDSMVNDHNGFLWIKGKPGCGKSTLIKTAFDWAEKKWPKQFILSYFFNARATGQLEKSSLGLYRSLVHQLVSKIPALRVHFLATFTLKLRKGVVDTWTTEELQAFLIHVATTPEIGRINIFVDALDEGDEVDIRQMVGFLEDLGQHSMSSKTQLRTCLSSRHYPHISLDYSLSLVVENQAEHDHDIEIFVRKKLRGTESAQKDELRREICRKSGGIFLWVVLVVPMLNNISEKGGSPTATRNHLETIPAKLEDLFAEILAKSGEDIAECLASLQWTLFSMRSLSPAELYVAVRSEASDFQDQNYRLPDFDNLQKYLLNCARGLIEITSTGVPVIQFIHETVRDFLLKGPGLIQISSGLASNPEGFSHDKLKHRCLQYIEHSNLFSESPFLEYAATNLFRHAEEAQKHGVQQGIFLLEMEGKGSKFDKWILLHNKLERYGVRRYDLQTSVLYILADQNLSDLTKCLLRQAALFSDMGRRYGNALQAACAGGHQSIVETLLAHGTNVNADGGFWKHALCAALHAKNLQIAQRLCDFGARLPPTLLTRAFLKDVARGFLPGVEFWLDFGADINCTNIRGETGLYMAVFKGNDRTARLLLENGANVNAEGGDYGNALQAASVIGREDLVRLLIDNEAELNTIAGEHGTALNAACYKEHMEIVQTLLDNGADLNLDARGYHTPLSTASEHGNYELVRLLLNAGANVNARGINNETPLYAASNWGSLYRLTELLNSRADTNTGGVVQGSLLQAIAGDDQCLRQLVQLLLDSGADVNAEGGFYGSPLQAAAAFDCFAIVQMLLDSGADVNIKGGCYGSPLQAAAERGYCKTVQLLIDSGADVNAGGGRHGSPLQAAAVLGYSSIVQMLLDSGAYVNAGEGP